MAGRGRKGGRRAQARRAEGEGSRRVSEQSRARLGPLTEVGGRYLNWGGGRRTVGRRSAVPEHAEAPSRRGCGEGAPHMAPAHLPAGG